MDEKPPCDVCEKFAERKGKLGPECETCMPDILPQNAEVVEVYQVVNTQYLTSVRGVLDIDINAIDVAMRRLGIDGKEVFMKVVMACRHIIKYRKDKAGG